MNPRQIPEKEALKLLQTDAQKLGSYLLSINKAFEEFEEPERRAVLSWIQNIGEQSRHLSDETREEARDIPWHFLLTFRNALAHNTHSFIEKQGWDLTSRFLEHEFPKFYKSILNIKPATQSSFQEWETETISEPGN
jgi:uncharacterized protein with HEPN domain